MGIKLAGFGIFKQEISGTSDIKVGDKINGIFRPNPPPKKKNLHKLLFSNSLHISKTIAYAKCGGQSKCIMGNWKIENTGYSDFPLWGLSE